MNLDEFKTLEGLAAALKSLDMVTAVPWTTYHGDSTVIGWTSYGGLLIEYKKIATWVFVNFRIYGTSDAVTTSFTLPFAEGSASSFISTCLCEDDGTRAIGFLNMSGSTVVFIKDATSASNGWTASGDKEIYGQFFYESA